MTAAERQAAYRSKERALAVLGKEAANDGHRLYELSPLDVDLIKRALENRLFLACNADSKAEYQDLIRRIISQSA